MLIATCPICNKRQEYPSYKEDSEEVGICSSCCSLLERSARPNERELVLKELYKLRDSNPSSVYLKSLIGDLEVEIWNS